MSYDYVKCVRCGKEIDPMNSECTVVMDYVCNPGCGKPNPCCAISSIRTLKELKEKIQKYDFVSSTSTDKIMDVFEIINTLMARLES